MAAFLDGCRFFPSAGGTTDWTYASAVGGYQSPAAAGVVSGTKYKYRAESADLTQWEIGEGAYNTSTGVLSRTTVLFNSSGTTSKISFTATPQVAVVALKEDLISVEEANSFSDIQKAQAIANLGVPFQCGRLLYSSATALTFKPYKGDLLKINGGVYRVPLAGVSGLANTGVYVNGTAGQSLAANTLYYVYAFNNSGTLTADFATAAHATSSTTGNVGTEIKSGDDTRSLIGMVYTNGSSQFSDPLTASWFNRRQRSYAGANTSPASPGNYFQEIGGGSSLASPGLRVYFLIWGDEGFADVKAMADPVVSTTVNVGAAVAIDGTIVSSDPVPQFTNGNHNLIVAVGVGTNMSEGLHYAVPFGGHNAGSVNYANAQTYVTARY